MYFFALLCVVTSHYLHILSSKAFFLVDFPPHPKPIPSPPRNAPNTTQPNPSPAFAVLVGSQVQPSSQQRVLLHHVAVSEQGTLWT